MTIEVWATEYASGMSGFCKFKTIARPRICPVDALVSLHPNNISMLDIGCGNGLLLYILWRSGKLRTGVGVDIDAAKLQAGQNALISYNSSPPISLLYGPHPTHWPKGPFDVCTMVDLLHHVPKSSVPDILNAAFERVKVGGLFIYKDMAERPRWAAAWNQLHDLCVSRQWITHVPPTTVVNLAAKKRLRLVSQFSIRCLAYQHDLLTFVHK